MIWKAAITSVTTKAMRLAIASGKGGTGKTTLAVNLASFLAQENETLLVDLDVEEPNSGIFIQEPQPWIRTWLARYPSGSQSFARSAADAHLVQIQRPPALGDTILVLPELSTPAMPAPSSAPPPHCPCRICPWAHFEG